MFGVIYQKIEIFFSISGSSSDLAKLAPNKKHVFFSHVHTLSSTLYKTQVILCIQGAKRKKKKKKNRKKKRKKKNRKKKSKTKKRKKKKKKKRKKK
jgi:hypothetical protein